MALPMPRLLHRRQAASPLHPARMLCDAKVDSKAELGAFAPAQIDLQTIGRGQRGIEALPVTFLVHSQASPRVEARSSTSDILSSSYG